ncbi:glycosyltransferase WbuB [Cryobacterium glaciale]|uniref:D-inositol 3-phosphate glycosyltransferase n=1 Tax=Cryobacterium glaciale TaxID=1259145 RepID=A0A4R8UTZ8_9MICO|nr:glycosyltransferase family 4 protein [Cryobacterium glaciale]TFB71889.1 glycosyltransferase WbuB [Cryobacterium glaciale]
MKIAIVSQYYRPENATITNSLAAGLTKRGHAVRVITGYPNFPSGRLYPGYRQRLCHRERDGGVDVRRVPIVVSHSQNPFGRIASYLSFALSSFSAGRYIADADVVYVYATQMTAAIAPLVWSRSRRIPFVLHVQDLWPESITGSSILKGRLAKRVVEAILTPWLLLTYQAASATVAIAPTMGAMLHARGVPVDKLHIVYNWNDDGADAGDTTATPSETDAGLTVTYAGNIGHLQDLATVIQAAHQVEDLVGFRLVLIGSGAASDELKKLAERLGAKSVVFRDRIAPSDMRSVYMESDFQIISLKNLKIFRGTIPSKLQASLSHGVPVITTVPGDVASLVQANGIGLTAEPEDVGSLARAFRAAFAMTSKERKSMGRRARQYYQANMTSDAGVDAIERILVGAANARGAVQRWPKRGV